VQFSPEGITGPALRFNFTRSTICLRRYRLRIVAMLGTRVATTQDQSASLRTQADVEGFVMLQKMKQWSRAAMAALASCIAVTSVALAQTQTGNDVNSTTTTTTTNTTMWYGQWWVWAVGVAVFLVIVIALTNRGGRAST
jgi:hypothetical protein